MIKLRNLSKFYYSKGIIASGLSRINLDLELGEFVVITGESGSGKSTLINVISGLDTYEEGEMYIDDKETSHYTVEDFENYRKKYIANIFQNFNLISSYTVYQNIELILLVEGKKKADVKDKINEIIDKVGLQEYRNTKVSKLSGGQKQRVAIARALAKETPIIVADEPTGNLDSESAKSVVKLLSELAKDRLVIVVTHNYDQFEEYATRRIKLHDGKLIEDDKIEEIKVDKELKAIDFGKITWGSKLSIGVRNTFNLIPKFLLLLFVFMFLIVGIATQYTSFKSNEEATSNWGNNGFFTNMSDNRIVMKKADNTPFTDEDFAAINKVPNIKSIFKEDMVLDSNVYISSDTLSFNGYPGPRTEIPKKLAYGRMPEADNEVVLEISKYEMPPIKDGDSDPIFTGNHVAYVWGNQKIDCKVVGIALKDDQENNQIFSPNKIYMSDTMLSQIKFVATSQVSKVELLINGKIVTSMHGGQYELMTNPEVSPGNMWVPEDVDLMYPSGSARNRLVDVKVKNIYFNDELELKVTNTYTKNNYKNLLKVDGEFDQFAGKIYMNPDDYNRLFDRPNYQISTFVKNDRKLLETTKELEKQGYKIIPLKEAKTKVIDTAILNIVQVPLVVLLAIGIFFICYFVIKLILKSRGTYFSILRILGLDMKNIKRILDIELILLIHIAYGLFLGLIGIVSKDIVEIGFIKKLLPYLEVKDYIILYVVVVIMAYIISRKFSKALFKKSAMGTYREEA